LRELIFPAQGVLRRRGVALRSLRFSPPHPANEINLSKIERRLERRRFIFPDVFSHPFE